MSTIIFGKDFFNFTLPIFFVFIPLCVTTTIKYFTQDKNLRKTELHTIITSLSVTVERITNNLTIHLREITLEEQRLLENTVLEIEERGGGGISKGGYSTTYCHDFFKNERLKAKLNELEILEVDLFNLIYKLHTFRKSYVSDKCTDSILESYIDMLFRYAYSLTEYRIVYKEGEIQEVLSFLGYLNVLSTEMELTNEGETGSVDTYFLGMLVIINAFCYYETWEKSLNYNRVKDILSYVEYCNNKFNIRYDERLEYGYKNTEYLLKSLTLEDKKSFDYSQVMTPEYITH